MEATLLCCGNLDGRRGLRWPSSNREFCVTACSVGHQRDRQFSIGRDRCIYGVTDAVAGRCTRMWLAVITCTIVLATCSSTVRAPCQPQLLHLSGDVQQLREHSDQFFVMTHMHVYAQTSSPSHTWAPPPDAAPAPDDQIQLRALNGEGRD